MHSYASRITKHFAELLWLYAARQASPFSKSTGKGSKHKDWRGGGLAANHTGLHKSPQSRKANSCLNLTLNAAWWSIRQFGCKRLHPCYEKSAVQHEKLHRARQSAHLWQDALPKGAATELQTRRLPRRKPTLLIAVL